MRSIYIEFTKYMVMSCLTMTLFLGLGGHDVSYLVHDDAGVYANKTNPSLSIQSPESLHTRPFEWVEYAEKEEEEDDDEINTLKASVLPHYAFPEQTIYRIINAPPSIPLIRNAVKLFVLYHSWKSHLQA